MKSAILLIGFVLFCFGAETDSVSSDTTIRYAHGAYTTFAQFLNNAPSVNDPTFTLDCAEDVSLPTDTTWNLMHTRHGKLRLYNEDLWGISLDSNVYIAVSGGALMHQKFRLLHILPSYSWYSEPYISPSMVSGGKISDPDIIQMSYTFVDMKNGKKFAITKPSIRQLLRDQDTELYQSFLADTHSDDRLIEYLEKLNERLAQINHQ